MRRTRGRARSREEAENPYWISFSDLMTALLAVFILAVVALVLQLTEKQEALAAEQRTAQEQRSLFSDQITSLQHAEEVRSDVLVEVASTLQAQGIDVIVSQDNSVLSIPTALLGFDSASFEIRPEHRDVALAIGAAIDDSLRHDERFRYLDTVFVEGHTDNQSFDGLEGTGNWGLSTFRAISLWRLWETSLPDDGGLDDLRRTDGSPLFSVSGYGETRPATNVQETDIDRAANRRIDVRFTVVRPTAENLAEILENADATGQVP
ncbi:OmpA/MotB family protein [Oerskovia gallyi]|nr:flagellar motor protein MotB [Oerskovia gallyi]